MIEAMHLSDAIDLVRPAVVQVLLDEQPSGAKPIGTGFIVTDGGHVLTARHVAEDAETAINQRGARLLVGLAMPTLSGPTPCGRVSN
jgi:hypothetical protein